MLGSRVQQGTAFKYEHKPRAFSLSCTYRRFLYRPQVIRHYHGHLSAVYDLDLHPTIDVLVTCSRDATARVRHHESAHVLICWWLIMNLVCCVCVCGRFGTSGPRQMSTLFLDTPTQWLPSNVKVPSHRWLQVYIRLIFYISERISFSVMLMFDVLCFPPSGSHDTTIRLWDLVAGKTRATLTNHKKSVRALVLHPRQYVSCVTWFWVNKKNTSVRSTIN